MRTALRPAWLRCSRHSQMLFHDSDDEQFGDSWGQKNFGNPRKSSLPSTTSILKKRYVPKTCEIRRRPANSLGWVRPPPRAPPPFCLATLCRVTTHPSAIHPVASLTPNSQPNLWPKSKAPTEAGNKEDQTALAGKKNDAFDRAEIALQVAVVLCSLTLLTGSAVFSRVGVDWQSLAWCWRCSRSSRSPIRRSRGAATSRGNRPGQSRRSDEGADEKVSGHGRRRLLRR